MREWNKTQRFALSAVARHFSADCHIGAGPSHAYATIGGRRIALDVAIITPPPGVRPFSAARLREDVVARGVLRDLENVLVCIVPNRKSLILTLGAPIKVPKKLVAALTTLFRDHLQSGAEERDESKTVLGNRVRFRVLNRKLKWHAKVIGFVFSGDPKPGVLADAMRSLHDTIAAHAQGRTLNFKEDRWLILSSAAWIADMKTYRRMYSQLSVPSGFKKILLVSAGGRVEPLTVSSAEAT